MAHMLSWFLAKSAHDSGAPGTNTSRAKAARLRLAARVKSAIRVGPGVMPAKFAERQKAASMWTRPFSMFFHGFLPTVCKNQHLVPQIFFVKNGMKRQQIL